MRPVGGSATEISDGGVGDRGGRSGGVGPGGHRENRSEIGVGGRAKWRAAEAVITGTDQS